VERNLAARRIERSFLIVLLVPRSEVFPTQAHCSVSTDEICQLSSMNGANVGDR